jgi:type IV secretion system protein VirB6
MIKIFTRVKKFIFLLFICFLVCDLAFAAWCNKDRGCGPCPSENHKYEQIICPATTSLRDAGYGNAVIGWGNNCAIPAGEQHPSSVSCISTGNVLGQVVDTLKTLGIGIVMRKNFCSAHPLNERLEGAIVSREIFNDCKSLSGEELNNCTSCVLKGKVPSDDAKGCMDSRAQASATQLNIPIVENLCNGIPNLSKPVLDEAGKELRSEDDKPVYCPITRCNIPTNDIKVKYHDAVGPRTGIISAFAAIPVLIPLVIPAILASAFTGSCCDIKTLKDNQTAGVALMGIVRLRGRLLGDRICAQMLFSNSYTTLACKSRIPPEVNLPKPACFFENIPANKIGGGFKSRWIFPITSKVVQIITEVFDSMLTGIKGCQNGLTKFQENMKNIVRVLLVLYVIIFGFQIATGSALPSKKDLFTFVLKFALVIYFSVGSFNNTPTGTDTGLVQLRKALVSGTSSLSNMIVSAANPGICNFSKSVSYAPGYDYLKMWDTLDCKLAYYLGLTTPTIDGFAIHNHGTGVMQLSNGLFSLIWGLIIGGNFLIVVFLFAFGIFLLSLIVYFTHLYIISLIAITIMIFFGPIFVPMALFEQTKGYFDAWKKLLLGYAVQPIIVVGVISMMISTFDKIIYSDCNFVLKTFSNGQPYWIWKTDSTTNDRDVHGYAQSKVCQKTLGFSLSTITGSTHLQKASATGDGKETLFKYPISNNERFKAMAEGLMLCAFFAFLFYFFSSQLGALAEELSGAPSVSGEAMKPTIVLDTLKNMKYTKNKSKTTDSKKGDGVKARADTVNGKEVNVINQADNGVGVSSKADSGVAVSNKTATGTDKNDPALVSDVAKHTSSTDAATKEARAGNVDKAENADKEEERKREEKKREEARRRESDDGSPPDDWEPF